MEFKHETVLLKETVDGLNVSPKGIYIDGTMGGAGHSIEILKRLDGGTLICIDRDLDAIKASAKKLEEFEKNNTIYVLHGNHEDIPQLIKSLEIDSVDGILLDLGMSSYQIDNEERGFSYIKDSVLDMRMDRSQKLTAKEIVNTYSLLELSNIFKEYGEEKFHFKIAKEIVAKRNQKEIITTHELVDIIDKVKPFSKKGHKAKQIFQALRIEVNGEIKNLENSIFEMGKVLNDKGRLSVITFHSLEDKAVKNAYKNLEGICTCPKDLPICSCNMVSYGKILTKKAILPTEAEIDRNSRSKSAKLRIFERNK